MLGLLLFLFDLVDGPVAVSGGGGMHHLWFFLPVGYLVTVLIETPILIFGLSKKLSLKQRFLCGLWLTACTYPIVVIVMPVIMTEMLRLSRWEYLVVAEVFAPLAECVLFWLAFRGRDLLQGGDWLRCFAAIVVANLASFLLGEVINSYRWFGLFS